MPKQVFIVGGGATGTAIARQLSGLGCTVTVADRHGGQVRELRAAGINALELDAIVEGTLSSSGALSADLVVVATGKSVQAGIYATMLLKHLGAPRVVACAETIKCAELLTRMGARVIYPRQQSSEQLGETLCVELANSGAA
jgi:trk system potassium uptake protein